MAIIAYIMLLTSVGREHEIAKEIEKYDHVTEAKVVYGSWDVVVRASLEDLSQLDELVTSIRKLDGVEQTSTLVSS
ncbi:MAG: Lrp/AsnC ligand binding domain-containing protein [Candidatus Freyarchaeota archaeon]|nr:Lrp/AsnC ligand binding domain-containing protein [Candidatus Freyarchaeota archaeon]MDO8089956.1 Lrp/AsnC ligand binding domain-containing protein [Candidatus Sigynarchaeota archaeon]